MENVLPLDMCMFPAVLWLNYSEIEFFVDQLIRETFNQNSSIEGNWYVPRWPSYLNLAPCRITLPSKLLDVQLLLPSNFSIFIPFIEILLWSLIGNRDPAFWPENVSPYYSLTTGESYVYFSLLFRISCRMFLTRYSMYGKVMRCRISWLSFIGTCRCGMGWFTFIMTLII